VKTQIGCGDQKDAERWFVACVGSVRGGRPVMMIELVISTSRYYLLIR
jgi:hypothetical protein